MCLAMVWILRRGVEEVVVGLVLVMVVRFDDDVGVWWEEKEVWA